MATILAHHEPSFPKKKFIDFACEDLEKYELKERSARIEQALQQYLPQNFPTACELIVKSLHPDCIGAPYRGATDEQGIQGWLIMPLTEFVGKNGHENFPLAMSVMRELTMRFSSEFGIRHLIIHDPKQAIRIMHTWCGDENEHVRRLVSEGSRPRLPWGLRIQHFVKHPTLTIPLLEKLADDESEYVRRSVANHLNDITKDHPDYACTLAEKWMKKNTPQRNKLIRHALRGLLKNGNDQALALLELSPVKIHQSTLQITKKKIAVGEMLDFTFSYALKNSQPQKIRIDYVIHYMTASGKLSPKVYRWSEVAAEKNHTDEKSRKHNMRPITTRKFYTGTHLLEIRINGKSITEAEFRLTK